MKRLRMALGTVFLALALFCGGVTAWAAQIDRSVLTLSQDWVRAGNTVELTYSLDGLVDVEDGLNALKGTLTYDAAVFADVRLEDFTPGDGWEVLAYNPENGQVVLIHKAGDRDGGPVFRLRLRANDTLEPAQTDLRFTDVSASEGREDLLQSGDWVPVQVIGEAPVEDPAGDGATDDTQAGDGDHGTGTGPQEEPSEPAKPESSAPASGTNQTTSAGSAPSADRNPATATPVPQNTAIPTAPAEQQSPAGTPVAGTDSGQKGSAGQQARPTPTPAPVASSPRPESEAVPQSSAVPQTVTTPETPQSAAPESQNLVEKPSKAGFFLVAGILLLLLLMVVLAARQGSLGKKIARVLAVLLVVGILATVGGGIVYGLQGKGDLNEDGQVDYTDVSLLGRHLVGLELLEQDRRPAADRNGDGVLTVTDLALLVREVEKTVQYEVELYSALENPYQEKNQTVSLPFQAQVSYDAAITAVTVNERVYPVTRTEDGAAYAIQVETGNQAGPLAFHFTQVTLDSGRTVEVEFTQTLEVLKDIPSVQQFSTQELTDSVQLQAKFLVADPDGALTGGSLELTRVTEEGVSALADQPVTAGWNEAVLDLPEGQQAQLAIYLLYDRTTGAQQEEADYTGTVTFQKDLLFRYDYGFTFGGLEVLDQEGRPTTVFGKNQPVVLQFFSENRSQFLPERVTVNGGDCAVESAGDPGVYRATVPGFAESGTQTLRVEQVVLTNGKAFPLDENQSATVQVQKTMPAVSDLTAQEVTPGQSLQVAFTLADPDGALSRRKVVVRDADGNLLLEQPFAENRVEELLTFPQVLTGAYTMEVVADCDISADGTAPQPGKILATTTLQAQPRVEVQAFYADKTYYEKAEPALLHCRLTTNASSPVEKLVVDNLAVDARQLEENLYDVSLPLQETAGEQTLTLSRVILADGSVLPAPAESRVQILRDLPALEDYKAQDDFDKDQVVFSFRIQDPDGALTSARAVLSADDGSEAPAEQILTAAGPQEFAFPVVEDKPYTFTVTFTSQRSADGTQSVEQTVLQCPIQMIRDYGLTVSEFTAAREDGTSTLYFEKGEAVQLTFQAQSTTRFVPDALISGTEEYPLTDAGNGWYTLRLSAGDRAGVQEFAADGLRMNNGKQLPLDNGRILRYEVLRDCPAVEGFVTQKTEQDGLQVQFTLQDPDGALQEARVKITDELGSVLLEEPVTAGPVQRTVPLTAAERYQVAVTASYDRDSDALEEGTNAVAGAEIFRQEVEASKDGIELKDVTDQILYLRGENGDQEVDLLDITQGLPDPSGYYALIRMKDLPDFYAGVREFHRDEASGKLYAILDQQNLVTYSEDGTKNNYYAFPVAYREGDTDHGLVESAQALFRQMAANPTGTFTLDRDLDASDVAVNGYAVAGTFSGTLNGNGHTIYNLPVGMFQKLSKATITDLVLEGAQITVGHAGILAGSIENQTVVEKVYLVDCSLRNSAANMVGGMTGRLKNAVIRHSAAINLTIQADNTIGGLVGQTDPGSTVEDCYVTGRLQGTRNNNLGARVGGISGWHSGAVIRRCLTKVDITAPKAAGNGGIIGGPGGATTSRISHCVSLGGGTAYRIAGFTEALSAAEEVYEYAGSDSTTNRTDGNADRIKVVETPDRAFFADTLGLDPDVWFLDLTDGNRLPSLQGDPMPKNETDYEIAENVQGIPSYQRVRAQADYRADREIAYANMAKLMPYADTADWVAGGNALPADSVLTNRAIRYILPLDETENLVSGLALQEPDGVRSVRLVYTDGTAVALPAAYHKALGSLVAVYRLDGSAVGAGELKYQFRGYLKDLAQLDLEGLVQTAAGLDYDGDIAALTSETEGRLYRDYYQQTVQPQLETVLRKLVLSQAQFPAYTGSDAVQGLVRQRLQDRNTLLRTLYAYNYYDKWYNIHFAGVNLSDLLFFSGDLLNRQFTAGHLTDLLLDASSTLRGTNKTYDFYTQILQPGTGKELLDFLADLAKGAGYDDPSDWFAAEFDGILVEQAPETLREGIEYRIWHAFNTLGSRRQIVLPIMTAPQEDMYILTVPSQLILGSMNRYNTYLNKDGGERARMEEMIRSYAQRYAHFYGISANWITDAPQILNGFVNIQYDTRFNFPANTVTNEGEQVRGVTQDPVIKWVYEAIGAYSDMGGVGAYANGTDVYCVAYPAIGTDFTFYALTHETAHNQDGRYFYAGYGRRKGTGAEAHADGNIAQQIEDGSMVFNISRICDPASDVTNNLSYERIETADQVWDYYADMFETSYVIDYLAGQAFLQLTPEEQARVAIQASEVQQGNSIQSIYTRLTADQLQAMDLKTMDDLWDNRIALKTPGKRASGAGAYGYESFYDINWYQPHFDAGMPDSSSFKRLGQEMLGVGGYENGYVTYISGKSANDLEALRTITGNPDITWRDYKLGRYAEVASRLDQIPYFDANQVIEAFQQVFRQDNDKRNQSIALQRTLYGMIKRATGDFTTGTVYGEEDPIRITSAEQLIQAVQDNPMGYYLLENDLDFSGLSATDGAYCNARFLGALDGNGHRLLGVSYPLFGEMTYAQVRNLTLEAPRYGGDAGAYLALSAKNAILADVRVSDANIQLPLVKQKSGGYYEWGDMGTSIGRNTITSVEDLLAISTSETAKKMEYVLEADLDFRDVALDAAVVSGTFGGKLDGNGHTIANLTAPLFEAADGAQIRNLNLDGAALTRDRDKGLLANTLANAQVENLRIRGSSLTNNSNQVGMLAGIVRSSTLQRISLTDITVSANNTVGGVAGQMDGTTLENCVVTGSVQGTLNHNLGSRAGGITGWLSGDSTLRNCYVQAFIGGAKAQGDGGLIGGPNTGNARMYNSVSLSTGPNAYRLSGFPVLGSAENLYELDSSDSLTNQDESNAERIKRVTEEQTRDPAFYTDALGWSEEVWDLGAVAEGGTPQLR